MKRAIAMFASVAFFAAFTPLADAQSACPPEVAKAKEMLHQKTGWIVQENIPKEPDVKMPRSLAGARPPEVQAPRGQDGQAPRGQDSQASRGQEVQAPRGQDTQAPRGQDIQAPRAPLGAKPPTSLQAPRSKQPAGITKAASLVQEAEAACKTGDAATAKTKAEAAISALK